MQSKSHQGKRDEIIDEGGEVKDGRKRQENSQIYKALKDQLGAFQAQLETLLTAAEEEELTLGIDNSERGENKSKVNDREWKLVNGTGREEDKEEGKDGGDEGNVEEKEESNETK